MKPFLQSLHGLWQQLGLNQRVSLVITTLAVIGGMVAVVLWSRRPDYQLLYARLGEKDAAAIISQLQAQNIPHQVTAGGGTVMVPADQVHRLRMELAGKGIPSGDGVGFEIFDKGQFGQSDFVQRTNYLRAVQGELGRTITQLLGVRAARVMIVQPENRLLLTDQNLKSTASVFVDLGGGRLQIDQVNAIRHLVANAVQGLEPDQVAVVDNHGRVLSQELEEDPLLATASSQMRYRQQVEDYLSRKVETMLAQVIGPGQAVVRVSADIDTEAVSQVSERFDPEGQVVRSQTTTEDQTITSENRSPGGAVGVSANVPDQTAAAAEANRPSSSSEESRKNRTTTYEINRTTTNTTRNPGSVRQISAAVFVAARSTPAPLGPDGQPTGEPQLQRRTPEELAALRQVVVNALGLRPEEGRSLEETVTLQEVPFATSPLITQMEELKEQDQWQVWLELARRWSPVAIAFVVLMVFWRMLRRQQPEQLPVEILAVPPEAAARAVQSGGPVTAEMLNELIRQKPTNIGTALRDWAGTNGHNKN